MKVKNFVQDLLGMPSDFNQIPLDFYQDFSDFFKQIGSSTGSLQNGVIGSTSFLTTVVGSDLIIQNGVCIASFNNVAPNNDFPDYCLGSDIDTGPTTLALANGKLVATLVYTSVNGTRTILSPAGLPVTATVPIERYLDIQYSIISGTPTAYQIYLYDVSGSTLTDRRVILFSGNNINGDGTTTSVIANTVSVKLSGSSIIPDGSSGLKINPTQSQDMEFDGKFTINNSTAPTSSISPIVIENTGAWASGDKPNVEILAAKVQIPSETYVDDITIPGNKLATLGTIPSTYLPPTVQRFLSGSSTYTVPTSPRAPAYIKVKMAGGGAGGQSSGSGGLATSGTASTFGSILTAGPGVRGDTSPGTGGVNTITTGTAILNIAGQSGGNNQSLFSASGISPGILHGGDGGNNIFSGHGKGGAYSIAVGGNALVNSGCGGGGASSNNTAGPTTLLSGTGGGAGGYLEVILVPSSSTYACVVGNGGNGGTAGTNGFAGGNGGSGIIIVEEYYQ